MTEVSNLKYAAVPASVDYDPIKSVEWALGSVQQNSNVCGAYPWEPKAGGEPKEALPVFGVKQSDNSPLDFGPYHSDSASLSTLSWPGQRAAPARNSVIMVFVNDLNGAKVPIPCKLGDTVESLRIKMFQRMHGQMKVLEHDDDADTRLGNAMANPSNPDTRFKTVEDVADTTTLTGNHHYSRLMQVEGGSSAVDRQLRKPVPIPGKYNPPKRCPQAPADLELYVGAMKMDDGQMEFNRSINTGAKPTYKQLHLYDFMISDGTVLRAEYTLSSAEYKMKDPDRDMDKLGALPDLDTACLRLRDTVLDPDFYVSTSEQMPRMLMEFFMPPGGDEDAPFVGRLQAMPEASAPARNPSYRTVYARAPATKARTRDYLPAQTATRIVQPPQLQSGASRASAMMGGDTYAGGVNERTSTSSISFGAYNSGRGRELQSTMV